jgi:hypothetical protein
MRWASPLGILLIVISTSLFGSDVELYLNYITVETPPCQEIFLPTRNIDYPPDLVIGPNDTIYFPGSNFVVYPGQCAYDTMSEVVHLNRIFIPGGYKGSQWWALYSSLPDGRIKNENLFLAC